MNFVTGATGILGSHVLLALMKDGRDVMAGRRAGSDVEKTRALFSHYGEAGLFEKIKWKEADITDLFSIEDALDGVTTVYHCAGFVSFDRRDRRELMLINETGTRNVVNACLHKNVTALCHVSSLAAIHNLDHTLPLHEAVFWKRSGKESDYAISKYNAEREVWRGMEEGLNAVIVNPGVILAPGFWDQSSSRMFNTCYKGNRFYTAGTTGYVSAKDAAAVMLQLVSKGKFANRYILVEGNYDFRAIFTRIQGRFKSGLPFIRASRALLTMGWAMESVLAFLFKRPPILTRALINSALNKQLYSNEKVIAELGYTFAPTPAVIDQICDHYLSTRLKTASSL